MSYTVADDIDFTDVVVEVPCPYRNVEVSGDQRVSHDRQNLVWNIGEAEAESEGRLEFTVDDDDMDEEAFYPIAVHFRTQSLYAGVDISNVQNLSSDEEFEPKFEKRLIAHKFQITNES